MDYWNEDLKLSEKMKPKLDNIYQDIFKTTNIKRNNWSNQTVEEKVLDKKLGVDCIITLKSGATITLQEKVLRNDKIKYGDFGIEYCQDIEQKTEGEWFHLSAQYYLSSYTDAKEEEIVKWTIVRVADFQLWFAQKNPYHKILPSPHSKAAAIYIPLTTIPAICILKKSW